MRAWSRPKSGRPAASWATTSPSTMASQPMASQRPRSSGNRTVASRPLVVVSVVAPSSHRTSSRIPSHFTSCTQSAPVGGASAETAFMGRRSRAAARPQSGPDPPLGGAASAAGSVAGGLRRHPCRRRRGDRRCQLRPRSPFRRAPASTVIWIAALAVLALAASTIVVAAGSLVGDTWYPTGDFSGLWLRVSQVGTRATPSSVPSRSRHSRAPGPRRVWLAAPLHWLSGGDPRSLLWTAAAINVASVVAIGAVAWRRGGLPMVLGVSVLVAVLSRTLTPETVVSFWNPFLPSCRSSPPCSSCGTWVSAADGQSCLPLSPSRSRRRPTSPSCSYSASSWGGCWCGRWRAAASSRTRPASGCRAGP